MGFHLLLMLLATQADAADRLDICHPLWLSRTPAVRACGETLRRVRGAELRALRHYFRPGAARDVDRLAGIAQDAEALLPDLSPYGRTAGLVAMVKEQANAGRPKASDIARLCDAAVALQEEILSQRGRQEHLETVLELRAKLSDLRRRADWDRFAGRERREILNAFALWARLASDALDRLNAIVADRRMHPLCGLLSAYVRHTVRASGRSMQARATEILPRRQWLILSEGTRAERRAAATAVAEIRAVLRRCAGGQPERLGDTDDRRVQSAVRALHDVQIQEALYE